MMIDSTNQKERQWTYIIFFLIGILSLPLGLIIGRLLANNMEGMWQIVFPLFICSILFAIAMYAFKVRSVVFALKAFAISFGFLFLIYVSWFMWSANEHEPGAISIKKFDAPQAEYSELTADELKGHPALEKALSGEGCTKFNENSWYCKVNPDEWRRTSDFVNKKQCNRLGGTVIPFNLCRKYLFSLDERFENDLNKGIVSEELRDVFESKGFSLFENAFIRESGERFWIVEPQNYPVWKDMGRLNVYDCNELTASVRLFKINETYYEIGFMTP